MGHGTDPRRPRARSEQIPPDHAPAVAVRGEHRHTPSAIRDRLAAGPEASYLRDWIYGGIDGAVTTFAVVSGVVGAQLSSQVILILGAANLLADGFSMAAGNFTSTRAEAEQAEYLRGVEERHIDEEPEGERQEIRQIFANKGFAGDDLERVVGLITARRELWIQTMLTEEYGLPGETRSPWLAAASTFSAFFVCGAVPLLPFVVGMGRAFLAASLLTAAVFFAIGCVRSRWSIHPWWRTGLETLTVGGCASALAYGVGYLLRGLGGG